MKVETCELLQERVARDEHRWRSLEGVEHRLQCVRRGFAGEHRDLYVFFLPFQYHPMARHLDLLWRFGVGAVDIVVGFEGSRIIEHVSGLDSRPHVGWQCRFS